MFNEHPEHESYYAFRFIPRSSSCSRRAWLSRIQTRGNKMPRKIRHGEAITLRNLREYLMYPPVKFVWQKTYAARNELHKLETKLNKLSIPHEHIGVEGAEKRSTWFNARIKARNARGAL